MVEPAAGPLVADGVDTLPTLVSQNDDVFLRAWENEIFLCHRKTHKAVRIQVTPGDDQPQLRFSPEGQAYLSFSSGMVFWANHFFEEELHRDAFNNRLFLADRTSLDRSTQMTRTWLSDTFNCSITCTVGILMADGVSIEHLTVHVRVALLLLLVFERRSYPFGLSVYILHGRPSSKIRRIDLIERLEAKVPQCPPPPFLTRRVAGEVLLLAFRQMRLEEERFMNTHAAGGLRARSCDSDLRGLRNSVHAGRRAGSRVRSEHG